MWAMPGQPFIEEMLEKIAQAARLREENGWHYKIMIDGSCNKKTFRKLYEAGAERSSSALPDCSLWMQI